MSFRNFEYGSKLFSASLLLFAFLGAYPAYATSPFAATGAMAPLMVNSDGSVTLSGWACNYDSPASIQVAVYIGNVFYSNFEANGYSGTVLDSPGACNSTGTNNWFTTTLPASVVEAHPGNIVQVYALSAYDTPNAGLYTTANLILPGASGLVTGMMAPLTSNSDGSVTLNGWACSLHDPSPIAVDVYVGGVFYSRYFANGWTSTTLDSECQSTGTNYWLAATIPASFVASNPGQSVQVYGVSPNGEADTLLYTGAPLVLPGSSPAETPIYRYHGAYAQAGGAAFHSYFSTSTPISGLSMEGLVFKLYAEQLSGTVPVESCDAELVNGNDISHSNLVAWPYAGYNASVMGSLCSEPWLDNGVIGYISQTQEPGTIPLYSSVSNNSERDALYSTSATEGPSAGYVSQSVMGYIPAN